MAEDTGTEPLSRIGHDLPVVPMTVYHFDGTGGVEEVGHDASAIDAAPVDGFVVVAGN